MHDSTQGVYKKVIGSLRRICLLTYSLLNPQRQDSFLRSCRIFRVSSWDIVGDWMYMDLSLRVQRCLLSNSYKFILYKEHQEAGGAKAHVSTLASVFPRQN